MAQNLTMITGAVRPAPQTSAQSRALSVFLNRLEPESDCTRIEKALAPSPVERRALAVRAAEVHAGLAAGDRLDMAEVVLSMFDAWPTMRMDAGKAKGVAVAYTEQLWNIPLWAAQEAARDCQGKAQPFPPSAGEFRASCEAKIKDLEEEDRRLRKVLGAVTFVPDRGKADEVKQRIAEVAKAFGAPFKPPGRRPDYRDEKAAATSRLHEMAREVGNEWRE